MVKLWNVATPLVGFVALVGSLFFSTAALGQLTYDSGTVVGYAAHPPDIYPYPVDTFDVLVQNIGDDNRVIGNALIGAGSTNSVWVAAISSGVLSYYGSWNTSVNGVQGALGFYAITPGTSGQLITGSGQYSGGLPSPSAHGHTHVWSASGGYLTECGALIGSWNLSRGRNISSYGVVGTSSTAFSTMDFAGFNITQGMPWVPNNHAAIGSGTQGTRGEL